MDTHKPQAVTHPVLSEIISGKDHLKTSEFARVIRLKEGSVRKAYRTQGHCCGVVPVIAGRGLLWPVSGILSIFSNHPHDE